jgi:hypothetical protein
MDKSTNFLRVFYVTVLFLAIGISHLSIAQEISKKEKKTSVDPQIPNSVNAAAAEIYFMNENNKAIITITDEGSDAGSITIPQSTPNNTTDKLYNEGGVLKFDGSAIGGSSISKIGDLDDAIDDGSSTFLGYQSGVNDNGLNYNVGAGRYSLYLNDEGQYNTAMGFHALRDNVSGNSNASVGYFSLYKNKGSSNTALGAHAVYANTTGNGNIGIGRNALNFNQTGSNNTAVGYEAGYGSSTQSYSGNIFLGYQAGYSETGSNKLYIENSLSSTPLIWGDFSADSVIINGGMKATSSIETPKIKITKNAVEGHYLKSIDDLGNAVWDKVTDEVGATEIDELSDGKYDAIDYAVYLGQYAGQDHVTNEQEISGNVGVGYGAMQNNQTGIKNVAIGYQANYSSVNKNGNTIVGYKAGFGSIGHGNVFIGKQAGSSETGDEKLYIENSSSSTPLIWGDFTNDIAAINGDFGVGTQSPTARVEIRSTGNTQDPLRVKVGGGTKLRVFSNGGTSIGTSLQAGQTQNYPPVDGLYVQGDVLYNSAATHTSDRRFKKNITLLSNSLEKLSKINGVTYNWKNEEFPEKKFSNKKQIGVIAQDVEKVFPELVITGSDGYKSVDYSKLTAIKISPPIDEILCIPSRSVSDPFPAIIK